MARPTTGLERARPDLAGTFEQFDLAENMMKMVASQVFPVRNVPVPEGTYPVVTAKELLRAPQGTPGPATPPGFRLMRAPRAGYVHDDLAFTEAPFRTVEHGNVGTVDEREAAHYSSYLEHEIATAQWVRHRLLVEREIRVASACFNTTTFASRTADAGDVIPSGGSPVPWSTWATSTPITDVYWAKRLTWNALGVWPDTAIMNQKSYDDLIQNATLRSRISSSGAGSSEMQGDITREQIASALGLRDIIVGGATYDSANPNAALSPAMIWGNSCLVAKLIRSNDIREIGLGHTFHWADDGSMPNGSVEEYYDVDVRGWRIRVRHQMQELLKYAVGYLITNTTTDS